MNKYVWNIINSFFLFCLMMIYISFAGKVDINESNISDVKKDIEIIQAQIDCMKKDTIVINIYNKLQSDIINTSDN